MRCEQARELMSLMLDEILTPEQKAELERHLRECVGCKAELKLLRTVQKLMATTEPAPLPYDLVPIVMERVRAIERERTKSYFWADLSDQGGVGWLWQLLPSFWRSPYLVRGCGINNLSRQRQSTGAPMSLMLLK